MCCAGALQLLQFQDLACLSVFKLVTAYVKIRHPSKRHHPFLNAISEKLAQLVNIPLSLILPLIIIPYCSHMQPLFHLVYHISHPSLGGKPWNAQYGFDHLF